MEIDSLPIAWDKKGGKGLGLAIVKQFVEAHGGQVSVESESGQGSTLRFIIPHEARVVEPACVTFVHFLGQPVEEKQRARRRDQPERQQQAERREEVRQEVAEGIAD